MMVMINPGKSGCSLLSSSALRVPALFRSCLYFLWLTSWFFSSFRHLIRSVIFGTKVKFDESFFNSFWHLPIGTYWYNYWRCIFATWFNIFEMCQSKENPNYEGMVRSHSWECAEYRRRLLLCRCNLATCQDQAAPLFHTQVIIIMTVTSPSSWSSPVILDSFGIWDSRVQKFLEGTGCWKAFAILCILIQR